VRDLGPDPQRTSYRSLASFTDPDGNGWFLQEIKQRLPGQVARRSVVRVARWRAPFGVGRPPMKLMPGPRGRAC
jgi:hypothetical protein